MSEEQLSPRDDEVRRLLADARHTGPMPDEVVARLDGVLADLAAEPARVRPVTDLATRRRRVTQLLVAAAAVVVVGVGIQQVVGPTTGSDDSPASSRAESAQRDEKPADADDGGGAPETTSSGAEESAPVPQAGYDSLVTLRPEHFTDDVTDARAVRATKDLARLPLDESDSMAFLAAGVACRADAWGQGTFVPVQYGRSPGVLVFRRALGDSQVADLFLCGSAEPTRSVTLPAP